MDQAHPYYRTELSPGPGGSPQLASESETSRLRLPSKPAMKALLSRRSLLLAVLARATAQDLKFSTSVNLVTLLATVRNRDGDIVSDLNEKDFLLQEDGRPQTIRFFSRDSNLPLTLGLLVDTSRSQIKVLEPELSASYAFLDRVLRNQDQAFVASFDINVRMRQGLTNSRQLLSGAIEQLQIPGRANTLLYDAIHQTSDDPMRQQKGRKAFILLSDGVDAGSGTTLGSAIENAQRSDTLLYSIWFHHNLPGLVSLAFGPVRATQATSMTRGKSTMQRLARETGGRFFEVTKDQSIESIFTQIEEELRNQYSFGYTSDHQGKDKHYRRVTLATTRPGLIVQTQDGYFPR